VRVTAPLEPGLERHTVPFFGGQPWEDVVGQLVPAEECFFVAASAGVVFGLRLVDGSRVAVKVIRPRPGLREACEVQAELHRRGFPCPRPLTGPVRVGNGYAVVHEWIAAPQRDLHDPLLRRAAAQLLAELIELAPNREGLPPTFAGARDPFPPPHDPRFDLTLPAGAWIDEVAREALARLAAPAQVVVGHSDWSAKHFGWNGAGIVVVYDWPDSVALDAEETIVGQASVTFPATWDLPVEPKLATPDEREAFLEEYEEAVGRRLDRARIEAARLYVLAYSARCELSDARGGDGEFQQALRDATA
jgi:hypothetical protein